MLFFTKDLVAWITLGTHHIPHSEDVPIVTTPGIQLTFYLLPYNYFDEDPSLASRDNIRVTPGKNGLVYKYAGVTGEGACPQNVNLNKPMGTKDTPPSGVSRLALSWLILAVCLGLSDMRY